MPPPLQTPKLRTTWQLDALLFWGVFSCSAIFILWVLNNTTKTLLRDAIEQRIHSTTRSYALLLNPQIHFEKQPAHLDAYLQQIRPTLQILKAENLDLTEILLLNRQDNQIHVLQNRALPENLKLDGLIQQAQETLHPILSQWNFLQDQILFFITPPAGEYEYALIAVPGWQNLPQEQRPVALILFNAKKIREELASVDLNSTNVIAISILLATALSLMTRRRSAQREEAVRQKLATLSLLRKRDTLLACALSAADRFIAEHDLLPPIRNFLEETRALLELQSAYYLDLNNSAQTPIGTIETPPFDFDLLKHEHRDWLKQLKNAQAITLALRTADTAQKEFLQKLQLRSLALIPVLAGSKLTGLLVLEHRERELEWEPGIISTLKLTANLFGAAILRKENETHLRQSSKMEALGRMAGGVAHEFNNLLHIITGNLAKLAEKYKKAENTRLNNILQAAQRGATIIDQLLRATRQSETQLAPASLNDVVARTVALVKPTLSKSTQLSIDLAPDLPEIPLDENLIQQVLLNILLNAQHALGDRPDGTIHITTDRAGNALTCSICDNGGGISAENLETIFEPFFTTKSTGTGLGLFTSRGILEQHGGTLTAANHPQSGAIFTLTLPVREIAAHTPISPEPSQDALPAPSGQTILIADDEPLCLQLSADLLEEQGYHIIQANDGVQLLQLAQEHRDAIQVVVTDWTMPGHTGAELVKKLREILNANTPILVTSGFIIEGDHPVQGVLRKPFQPNELFEIIQKNLII